MSNPNLPKVEAQVFGCCTEVVFFFFIFYSEITYSSVDFEQVTDTSFTFKDVFPGKYKGITGKPFRKFLKR